MTPVLVAAVKNIKIVVDAKPDQGRAKRQFCARFSQKSGARIKINYAAKLQKGRSMLPYSKEGRIIKMLEFDEFKLELDKYKGSLAELGESL